MPRADEKKILIVDNDSSSLTVYTAYLKRHPHLTIRTARNGYEALEIATQDNFDLIHINIQIPKLDGIETIKRLRMMSNYQYTPILVISTVCTKCSLIESKKAGGNEFIRVPISRENYLDKIEYYTSSNYRLETNRLF